MTPPPPATTAVVQWFVRTLALGGLPVPIGRLEVNLSLPRTGAGSASVEHIAWLDTGAPLGLIPYRIQQAGLLWRPVPGVQVNWNGLPCDVGSVDVWLLDLVSSSRQGPFAMLAKFLRAEPLGAPPPFLLGLEFFLAHHAALALDPPPGQGAIRTP